MTTESHDVIVVGLGAMGSAAVYQLASRGVRVLGIDRLSPPHTHGSTHGDTRITRLAIGEGMVYVPLAMRSHQLWREIEAQTGADLLTANGCLILGRAGTGFGFHGKADFLHDSIAAAEAFGIAHEVLEAAEVSRRFPQFALVGDETGYLEPAGGFLRPEACVRAQLTLAAQRGADIHRDERVESFATSAGGVVVRTARGEYSADRLILSAGPWIAGLLGGELGRRFAVYRQAMHWFAIAPPHQLLTPARLPVYIWEVSGRDTFYGFPAIDGEDGGMKVATEQFARPTDPASVDRRVPEGDSQALYDRLVGARLPQLQRRRVKAVSCLYTTTRDGDFVIDWHPQSDNVLIVSPCSGHGFKHSAAVGEAAAELVTQGTSTIDVRPFSLERFAAQGPRAAVAPS
jgi:sarcosine oxidase